MLPLKLNSWLYTGSVNLMFLSVPKSYETNVFSRWPVPIQKICIGAGLGNENEPMSNLLVTVLSVTGVCTQPKIVCEKDGTTTCEM